jgi:hypothetical protein
VKTQLIKRTSIYAFGLGSTSFVGNLMYKSGHVVSLEVTHTHVHVRYSRSCVGNIKNFVPIFKERVCFPFIQNQVEVRADHVLFLDIVDFL